MTNPIQPMASQIQSIRFTKILPRAECQGRQSRPQMGWRNCTDVRKKEKGRLLRRVFHFIIPTRQKMTADFRVTVFGKVIINEFQLIQTRRPVGNTGFLV